jgi:hypothetical protein
MRSKLYEACYPTSSRPPIVHPSLTWHQIFILKKQIKKKNCKNCFRLKKTSLHHFVHLPFHHFILSSPILLSQIITYHRQSESPPPISSSHFLPSPTASHRIPRRLSTTYGEPPASLSRLFSPCLEAQLSQQIQCSLNARDLTSAPSFSTETFSGKVYFSPPNYRPFVI